MLCCFGPSYANFAVWQYGNNRDISSARVSLDLAYHVSTAVSICRARQTYSPNVLINPFGCHFALWMLKGLVVQTRQLTRGLQQTPEVYGLGLTPFATRADTEFVSLIFISSLNFY